MVGSRSLVLLSCDLRHVLTLLSAGTVCVLASAGPAARSAVQSLAEQLARRHKQPALVFEGSSHGAEVFQSLQLQWRAHV